MGHVKPVIAYDLDGTLLDSRSRHLTLADEALQKVTGGPLSNPERFWRMKRKGLTTDATLKLLAYQQHSAAAAYWVQHIEDRQYLRLDGLQPGAIAALELARTAGYTVIIVTARRSDPNVRAQVEASPLRPLVSRLFVVPPGDDGAAKAEVLRGEGATCFIGDTEADRNAAAAAGVPFAAVSCGMRSRTAWRRWGITHTHPDAASATKWFLDTVDQAEMADVVRGDG